VRKGPRVSNIAVIGAGQLGSRHIQSLVTIGQPINLTIVEPSEHSLNLAKTRVSEVQPTVGVTIRYLDRVRHINHHLDLAIIATNSDVRRRVIEDLINTTQTKYLLLEKVVFQNTRDFEAMIALLHCQGIQTWVNCPRRIHPFFIRLREKTLIASRFALIYEGRNWGLACNGIHFLDLFLFLSGRPVAKLDNSRLSQAMYESKREGFFELKGELSSTTERHDYLQLIDTEGGPQYSRMIIRYDSKKVEIDFHSNEARCWSDSTVMDPSSIENFIPQFQSQLTASLVREIFATGRCGLTPLNESYEVHKPFLTSLNDHFSRVTGQLITNCPIT
jgi:hypothetical protein